ncbi:mitochondrial matrix Mmp37-domain-containing protein [Phakopsora pachyrhizi]|nr:mitochondrial matrix Mmp37-domain-containing protein [Phakopsora pachyrhizi]
MLTRRFRAKVTDESYHQPLINNSSNRRSIRLLLPNTLSTRPHPSHPTAATDLLSNCNTTSNSNNHRPGADSTDDDVAPQISTTATQIVINNQILSKTLSNTLPFNQNQNLSEDKGSQRDLQQILNTFKAPIRYGFGYGSAIFSQTSSKRDLKSDRAAKWAELSDPMYDFIFAVSHPNHWHSINLQQNPKHYSLLARSIGSSSISWLQQTAPGAGLWFNIENRVNRKIIKYGVISIDELCDDLLDWKTLYISGRMHKPTMVLKDDPRIRLAQQVNLSSALRTSLLLLPERFEELELYRTICSLSYQGDFRFMIGGEDPRKVEKIVEFQFEMFRRLYEPLLKPMRLKVLDRNDREVEFKDYSDDDEGKAKSWRGGRRFRQDFTTRGRIDLFKKLPTNLRKIVLDSSKHQNSSMSFQSNKNGENRSMSDEEREEELLKSLLVDQKLERRIREGLRRIVFRSSLNQSLKGLISNGPIKSFRYAFNKLCKGWLKSF